MFDYYVNIAEVMVPHIAGRPVTRKRWPNGVDESSFFEKQLRQLGARLAGPRQRSTHKSGTTTYPIIDTVEGLAWIAPAGRAGGARAAVAVRRRRVSEPARRPASCSTSTPATT